MIMPGMAVETGRAGQLGAIVITGVKPSKTLITVAAAAVTIAGCSGTVSHPTRRHHGVRPAAQAAQSEAAAKAKFAHWVASGRYGPMKLALKLVSDFGHSKTQVQADVAGLALRKVARLASKFPPPSDPTDYSRQ
jgi:ABC-type glycerol-3-phosphate transport system substrate-binding protein